MGDIGMDKWLLKMSEHIRKGHHFIMYNERTVNEQDILLKEQRIKFWELHKRIPALNELNLFRLGAEA